MCTPFKKDNVAFFNWLAKYFSFKGAFFQKKKKLGRNWEKKIQFRQFVRKNAIKTKGIAHFVEEIGASLSAPSVTVAHLAQ